MILSNYKVLLVKEDNLLDLGLTKLNLLVAMPESSP